MSSVLESEEPSYHDWQLGGHARVWGSVPLLLLLPLPDGSELDRRQGWVLGLGTHGLSLMIVCVGPYVDKSKGTQWMYHQRQ